MWLDLVRDMPQGLPQVGDRGLDYTHTWGRTYWGGALFCLLADVEIRRQTNNGKGLEHALRGILDAGGDIRWTQLGVQLDGTSVHFDDNATLAAVRRAITTRESTATQDPTFKLLAVFVGRALDLRGWPAPLNRNSG
jgi:agmatine/peptidylarginine deiminase